MARHEGPGVVDGLCYLGGQIVVGHEEHRVVEVEHETEKNAVSPVSAGEGPEFGKFSSRRHGTQQKKRGRGHAHIDELHGSEVFESHLEGRGNGGPCKHGQSGVEECFCLASHGKCLREENAFGWEKGGAVERRRSPGPRPCLPQGRGADHQEARSSAMNSLS